MSEISLHVQSKLCEECSLALRRFVGNIDGVESVDVENGRIVISFDASMIPGDRVRTIARDSVEKLGYKLIDEQEEQNA
ncbi:MAG: heavy-metal-associated domain-containing protein [Nitrospirae bacterium]|nr:heavy-metal-associated domain-containing protein [Nitrospirota bacterium]